MNNALYLFHVFKYICFIRSKRASNWTRIRPDSRRNIMMIKIYLKNILQSWIFKIIYNKYLNHTLTWWIKCASLWINKYSTMKLIHCNTKYVTFLLQYRSISAKWTGYPLILNPLCIVLDVALLIKLNRIFKRYILCKNKNL